MNAVSESNCFFFFVAFSDLILIFIFLKSLNSFIRDEWKSLTVKGNDEKDERNRNIKSAKIGRDRLRFRYGKLLSFIKNNFYFIKNNYKLSFLPIFLAVLILICSSIYKNSTSL